MKYLGTKKKDNLVNIFDVFRKQIEKQVTHKFNLLRSSFIVCIDVPCLRRTAAAVS